MSVGFLSCISLCLTDHLFDWQTIYAIDQLLLISGMHFIVDFLTGEYFDR